MNKFIILPFFLLLFEFSFAQIESLSEIHPVSIEHLELPRPNPHGQIIMHTGYTLSYNTAFHIANWVAYELTAEETVPVVKRNNKFIPDPLLSSSPVSNADYKGSGYDIIRNRTSRASGSLCPTRVPGQFNAKGFAVGVKSKVKVK
jgi:hypothetical protein